MDYEIVATNYSHPTIKTGQHTNGPATMWVRKQDSEEWVCTYERSRRKVDLNLAAGGFDKYQKDYLERRANAVLDFAKRICDNAKSWADFSNELFSPHGIMSKYFRTKSERELFLDTKQYKEINEILTSLMHKFGVIGGANPTKKPEDCGHDPLTN